MFNTSFSLTLTPLSHSLSLTSQQTISLGKFIATQALVMATVVCQGLQSCLESQFAEQRALRLKLFAHPQLALKPCLWDTKEPREANSREEIWKNAGSPSGKDVVLKPDTGCWSFLQALSCGSNGQKDEKELKENTYVHPLSKHSSSSTLSAKSLELCTEKLGSETGTDIAETCLFPVTSNVNASDSPTRESRWSRQSSAAKKTNAASFPPPLTTIRGSETLQFRPHREDGRLLLEAVKVPSIHSSFQAERSNGRLRLSLLKDTLDSEEDQREEIENECSLNVEDCEEDEGEDGEDEYEEEDEDGDFGFGAEMGMETMQMLGRCVEGEHENKRGLLNWGESFWVATS